MTTIISNGYYLIADTRETISYNDSKFLHKNEEGIYEQKEKIRLDTCLKINLIDFDLYISKNREEGKVKAYAISGHLLPAKKFFEKIKKFISNAPGSCLKDFYYALSNLGYYLKEGESFTFMFVTENNFTIKFIIGNRFQLLTYEPGRRAFAGSGWNYLSNSIWERFKQNYDQSILNCFRLMVIFDEESSSPTYSVFGVNENILYAIVEEPQEVIDQWTKEITEAVFKTGPRARPQYV